MILDSSFVIDLLADDPDAFQNGVEMVDRGEMRWLPTPVLAAIFCGASTTAC